MAQRDDDRNDRRSAPVRRSDGRVPPHNLHAEESLLGALLLSREVVGTVAELGLQVDHFYKPAHQHVYAAIRGLMASGQPVDVVTVADDLRRNGLLDEIGGAQLLLELQNATPAISNASRYAKIVQDTAVLRRMISVASEIAELAYQEPDDVTKALDEAETKVFEVAEDRVIDSTRVLGDLLPIAMDRLQETFDRGDTITGTATGFNDLDEIMSGLQPSTLNIVGARPAMGKCVAWDTPMVDPISGAVRTAEAWYQLGVDGQQVGCTTMDDSGTLIASSFAGFYSDGYKPLYRVATRSGRVVRITGEHPLLTGRGWQPLATIGVGTRIAVPRSLEVFGNADIAGCDVDLLAVLIGDGTVGPGQTTPRITSANDGILAVTEQAANELGCELRFEAHAGEASTWRIVSGDRGGHRPNPVIDLLRRHGVWGCGAHDKRVPSAIFEAPRATVARFLNRLFATDGSAWVAKSGYARICYGTVSEQLSIDVTHLLLRFGIRAKRRERMIASKGVRRLAFEIEVMDSDSLVKFCDQIAIVGKETAVAEVAQRVVPSFSIDTLPLEVWDDVVKAKGERSWAELSRAAGKPSSHNWHAYRRRPRRETIATLARVLDCDVLRRWSSPDISWDEVVAIEPCGWDRVYDFNVPGTHNFVAADILVHNTAFGLGIATHIAMTAKKPVLFFSLEMGHAELTQRVLSSEARVDSQKLRSGRLVDSDWTKIGRAINRLEVPLYLDDNPRVTVMEIRAKARRMKARMGGLALIVIDYLQLMSGGTYAENRQLEVSEISRGLKILARELETPIIALSQLSRNLETRGDKRPMLADLRESGCLVADTRLVRADTNEEVLLGDLVRDGVQDIPLWSLDERYRLVPGRLLAAFPSGVKEVFRLRLASGREVHASANHPFLRLEGWAPLDQLSVGDHIASARTLPATSASATMTDDELILLGHLIGDGCTLDRHAVQYTTIDPDNMSAVAGAAERRFGVTARITPERQWTQVYLPSPFRLTNGRHHPISDWMRGLGAWNRRSWEKRVPAEVFRQPKDSIALFLRHLWATDGSISVRKNGSGVGMYYSTSSRQLADGVMDLLLRLDIRSRVTVVPSTKGRTGYQVSISGKADQLRFATDVGVHGQRGRLLESAIERLESVTANPNVDIVPKSVWDHVRHKALPEAGMTARQLAESLDMQYCGSALYKSGLSRARCERVALATGDTWLHDLAMSDVLWDRIVEIASLGEQEVFDATIEGTHNFVANGLVAHNSLEQDADVVMFLYRDEIYNRESPDKGAAEVIIAKHRSGPTGVVRLVFNGAYTRFDNAAKGLN